MDAASILLVLAVAGANIDSQPESVAAKRHTSYFAGQSGWISDQSSPPAAAPPTGDRYQLGATGGSSSVGPPPSVVDRTQAAVVESGNALRDGVEAGIPAANRQLYQGNEQVIETARNAGQELSTQFQRWAGSTAQQAGISAPTAPGVSGASPSTTTSGRQQVSNPFATTAPTASSTPSATSKSRTGVAPPPWLGSAAADEADWPSDTAAPAATPAIETPRTAALGRAPVQTDSGWTSVHSSVAPPRLAPPKLINSPDAVAPITSASASAAPLPPLVGQGGPNFPATITSNQSRDHSVLAPPTQSQPLQQPPAAATAADNWDFGWDGKTASQPPQAVTIGNRYETAAIPAGPAVASDRDFAKAEQPTIRANNQQPVGQTLGSPPASTFGIGAWDKDGWPENPATPQAGAVAPPNNPASAATVVGNAGTLPAMGSTAAAGILPNGSNVGTSPAGTSPPDGVAPALPVSNAEQVPWMPLLVVSLALAGSIGANLFLGWSYVNARQKYRTLVQKTANKFRRAVAG